MINLSKEILEYIIDFLPDAMFAIDREGRVIKWNKAVEELTGVKASDILGKGDYEVAVPFYGYKRPVLAHYAMEIDKSDIEKSYSTIKVEGNVLIAEIYVPFPGYRKDGAWLWGRAAPLYDKDENIIGAVEVVRDITQRKKMEEERLLLERKIFEDEKEKSIEILSAGVAHDFNNILMAILGYIDIINVSLENNEQIKRSLDQIRKAVLRGSELSKQLLRFSGRGDVIFKSVNPVQIVKDILDLLRVSISKKIELIFNTNDNLLSVRGDATQLRQVIMNLVLNAAEAIGEGSGYIRIDIGSIYIDNLYKQKKLQDFEVDDGYYIKIEISDNGSGMDEETAKHIFEPFFSTKFQGRGLGLSEVVGIVKAHRGAITLSTRKNEGTKFEIFLPVVSESDYNNEEEISELKVIRSYSGTVLLADDEDAVRFSIGEMLKKLGFSILMAENGRDALNLYSSLKEKPDILFLDILMPKMDGVEVLNEIRKIVPDQKVVFISGFTGNKINLSGLNEKITKFIHKPFNIYKLSDVVSELMDKKEE